MQCKLNCEHAHISISGEFMHYASHSFEAACMNTHRNVPQRGASILRWTVNSGREENTNEGRRKIKRNKRPCSKAQHSVIWNIWPLPAHSLTFLNTEILSISGFIFGGSQSTEAWKY